MGKKRKAAVDRSTAAFLSFEIRASDSFEGV